MLIRNLGEIIGTYSLLIGATAALKDFQESEGADKAVYGNRNKNKYKNAESHFI